MHPLYAGHYILLLYIACHASVTYTLPLLLLLPTDHLVHAMYIAQAGVMYVNVLILYDAHQSM